MLDVAICDDEKVIVSQMETMLLKVCKKTTPVVIDAFYSGQALEKEVLNCNPK